LEKKWSFEYVRASRTYDVVAGGSISSRDALSSDTGGDHSDTLTGGNIVFGNVNGVSSGGNGSNSVLATLTELSELLNWSLTTPGEITIYQTLGYPVLSGMRVFYQPIFKQDNGSPVTIGPTSFGIGATTLGYNGSFRYKQGLNSVSALDIAVPGYNFQPWAFKVSMDTSLQVGDFLSTNRVGAEFTARSDNWAYVGAIGLILATGGYALRFYSQIPSIRPIRVLPQF
jgi:hypothetical protein